MTAPQSNDPTITPTPTAMEQSAQEELRPTSEPAGGTVIIRERKKSRKRKSHGSSKRRMPTWAKVLIGIVAAIVLIAAVAFAFVQYNIHKGNAQLHEPQAQVEESNWTVSYGGHEYRYNPNVVAVMVMGKDDESNYGTGRSCTDANMLVTLDTETKAMNVVAIPRDSMVNVDLYNDGTYVRTGLYQLAVAYGVDVPSEDTSARNTMTSVSRLLYDMPIERYFVLEMDAVPRLATAVGGVKVEALDTYPGAPFEVGDTVMLEGDAALKYIRYRDINVDQSAQGRQQRQMQFVQAFLSEIRASDVQTIMDLYSTVQDTTFTNLDLSEITYLVSLFVDGRKSSIEYTTLQGQTKLELDDDGVEREHIYLDDDSVMTTMLKVFYTQVD